MRELHSLVLTIPSVAMRSSAKVRRPPARARLKTFHIQVELSAARRSWQRRIPFTVGILTGVVTAAVEGEPVVADQQDVRVDDRAAAAAVQHLNAQLRFARGQARRTGLRVRDGCDQQPCHSERCRG